MDTYVCAICQKEFEYEPDWSDADALQELSENFPGMDVSECILLCDDCYQAAMQAND